MKKREKKRINSLIVIVSMLLTMISGIANRVQAAAVTYNVSDYSSLTAAISAAVDGDTINITNNITITAEIRISKALIIEGNNHIITVPVPGLNDSGVYNNNSSNYRVFNINAAGKTVEIDNLTIKGGCIANPLTTGTSGMGAGIYNYNTILKLNNINISNSRTKDPSPPATTNTNYGGGIVNDGGTVYLKNSNISRNAAEFGGGFLNRGSSTMFIENCTISENRSTRATGGGGGGQNNGTLYVNNSTFSNNKSTELGGAINNRPSGTAYFVNSTFTGNVAYGVGFDGGAIANNGGTLTALNCLFAYNYYNNGSTASPNYILNDISNTYNSISAYYCIFHASSIGGLGNTKYNGNANGSDNSIFTNGINTLMLDGNGQTVGTNTIFQPMLTKVSGIITPTAPIKTGSFALSKGVKTGFTNGNGSPVIGYYNGTTWQNLIGTNSGNYEVTTDQNNVARTGTPTAGAVETVSSMSYMLKVNAATGGTVNGGTIYGDTYAPGSNVTLTAIPDDGYAFTRWDYVDGGTGTASTSNPYTLTVTQNTTLVPVFSATSNKSVTYVGNGSTGGTVPNSINITSGSSITVSDNTGNLVKSGYAFAGWNTAANGSGTHYAAGNTFTLNGNIALYAQWTPATVPDAPTNASATVGDASTAVTWIAPANNGGSPITDYLVEVYNEAGLVNTVDTHSTTTSAAITGLANGTIYTFDVKAVNSIGNSAASNGTSAVTPTAANTVPDAPTNASATVGDASAAVTWIAPANNGGSPITDYLVEVYNGASLVNTVDTHSTTTSAAITGLANGTIYTFDVKAVNSVGNSAASNGTSAVIPTGLSNSYGGGGSSGYSNGSVSGATITANVIDGSNGNSSNSNCTSVASVNATVVVNTDGTDTISVKQSDAVVIKQPDGSIAHFEDYSKIGYIAPSNAPITINSDGNIQVSNLIKGSSYDVPVTYDMGNGQKITIGNMHISVNGAGNVNMISNLIDPYGIVTDLFSGKAISGANITLYYADTARNKAAGISANTVVKLPAVNGFKPNNNINPQNSDEHGAYGFMVFPTSDYYIVATKDGYNKYISPTIHVENELVKWNFKMHALGAERLFGQDRIDTALQIAKATFVNNISSVILASSENYPDALAGTVLAYKLNAPILLVGSDEADQAKILSYLKDNMDSAGTVYILGGIGVVSKDMETKVSGIGFKNIIRLGGADRFETAAKIADKIGAKEGTPIVIVSGENYPDALSISSIAAVNQYPIFMVNKNEIPEVENKEISLIKPSKIYIIGAEGVVNTAVENQVAQIAGIDKIKIVRIGGLDRFETSLMVIKHFGLSGDAACIASGNDFPDALAGSIYAADNNAPILLVNNSLTEEQRSYLRNAKLKAITIFGGIGAVSKEVEEELTQICK